MDSWTCTDPVVQGSIATPKCPNGEDPGDLLNFTTLPGSPGSHDGSRARSQLHALVRSLSVDGDSGDPGDSGGAGGRAAPFLAGYYHGRGPAPPGGKLDPRWQARPSPPAAS
eukprot:gene15310-biopygen1110